MCLEGGTPSEIMHIGDEISGKYKNMQRSSLAAVGHWVENDWICARRTIFGRLWLFSALALDESKNRE